MQLQPEQIALWANKLEQDTGVHLGALQASLLGSQIKLRMQALGLEDADSYYAQVCSSPPEWQSLLARLLVKETQFFRNREALAGIQAFVRKKLATQTQGFGIDVCSLGCATGEEAYSLAASLQQALAEPNESGHGNYYSVTGVDLCAAALQTARAGLYPKSRLQQLTAAEIAAIFDPEQQQFRVKQAIKNRVTFIRGNLCDIDSVVAVPMDVIVCLNVLIYFRRWRRRALLNQLVNRLKPGGLLIIGSGELPGWQNSHLTALNLGGVQAYQRH
ncbi:CheR family methyltransferase [Halioxenophilus aromaticivorans]|uniref:protein-glutamate O-methyltransferase n=1 Tax=Halioxenophilus aromaticivorans TaxID=1306992 RepID=A0AAV3U0I1_9ALTE